MSTRYYKKKSFSKNIRKVFDNFLIYCIIAELMLHDIHVSAPAKINIGLRVLPVRSDGYHDIESIFQTVPLYDELFIRTGNTAVRTCTVVCDGMDLPEHNTLTAAYDAFCSATGITDGVAVTLKKRIPSGAGLGGGSADAAAFIKALNVSFETKLTADVLHGIAGKVGSDVFFFLSGSSLVDAPDCSGCAVVTGRGEKVFPITPRTDLHFVLICPDVHSSTGEAYRLVDAYYASGHQDWNGPSREELYDVYKRPVKSWSFVNSFTEPLVQRYPLIGQALDDLVLNGASYVQMSGSGSAVFGVFEDSDKAVHACFVLGVKWKRCYTFASS
ncbi:4-diphosphocytidyl-2-C-methyl-D-erythritolkinase [Treponema brennaborense DSM 12168]|uniref:4-diphosphocytidyl-2-C-methyl-D-erythritol kinase n=2 Tax=Treponema TaxID=157 RepID=F4LQI5_TREBD|nr:4-diphosphocytidyl-2-C-methyl-D-erythritolkinase [Treponema brennaborense DSM 12168]